MQQHFVKASKISVLKLSIISYMGKFKEAVVQQEQAEGRLKSVPQ